jgi:hypothetical protein
MVDQYVLSQIQAREVSSVIKTKLLQVRSQYPVGIILAVEGDDDKCVYSCWVGRVRPLLCYEFLVCGGKRQVRNLKNALINDRANLGSEVVCIVDRDFDDLSGFLNTDAVLMLDRYSIENFLVDRAVLDTSLSVAYPCNGKPSLREGICQLFEADYDEFLRQTYELNRTIYIGRRLKMDLDKLISDSIHRVVSIELGAVTRVDHDIREILALPRLPTPDEELALSEEFAQLNPRYRYRGKFALKFLIKWLDKLAEEFRSPKLGLFGLLSANDGKIQHRELNLGAFASRSTIPFGLETFLP